MISEVPQKKYSLVINRERAQWSKTCHRSTLEDTASEADIHITFDHRLSRRSAKISSTSEKEILLIQNYNPKKKKSFFVALVSPGRAQRKMKLVKNLHYLLFPVKPVIKLIFVWNIFLTSPEANWITQESTFLLQETDKACSI